RMDGARGDVWAAEAADAHRFELDEIAWIDELDRELVGIGSVREWGRGAHIPNLETRSPKAERSEVEPAPRVVHGTWRVANVFRRRVPVERDAPEVDQRRRRQREPHVLVA